MRRLEDIYSENAINIYERLYLARNNYDEIIEDIDQCHHRVANYLAKSEYEYAEFRRLLDEQKFRPNTPCMANAGIKDDPMMLACFVLGLEDDMSSIIEMWSTCAKIYEGGGGAGIPITNLRKKGAVLSKGGYASGPLSYLNVIETISNEIKSGGKQRRAANLISSRYDHPDIVEIINCKRSKDNYKSMNLSISIDDQFMKNVCKEKNAEIEVKLIDPNKGHEGQTISAQGLWYHICRAAWECGDPGLLFIDRVNRDNPLEIPIESTNPCGEVDLWPWFCCNLGHLNITKYDFPNCCDYNEDFEKDVYWATLFLNRIIERTSYPNQKFKENMLRYRPIGLGLMGFADVLYKNNIKYGSQRSFDLLEAYTASLTKLSYKASAKLVDDNKIPKLVDKLKTKEKSSFFEFISRFVSLDKFSSFPGNIKTTCLAPTGSTSVSASSKDESCSYSFEPKFALFWIKQLEDGSIMEFLDPHFEKAIDKDHELSQVPKQEIIDELKANKGSIQNLKRYSEWMKDVFITAHDIPNSQRIEMQATAQQNISMAVSSTVNLPSSATIKDISETYKLAWHKGLKGITVYRDGCLDYQPVDFGSDDKASEAHTEAEQAVPSTKNDDMTSASSQTKKPFGKDYKRPAERNSKTYEANTPDGKLYVTGSFDHGYLMETFISIGKQGRRENTFLNGLGRVISRALQRGVELEELTDTLRGTGGDSFFFKLNETDERSVQVNGILDALAIILDDKFSGIHFQGYVSKIDNDGEYISESHSSYDRCPECQRFSLRMDAGCRGGICTVCGYSNCG